jgi:hypothetical protein
MGKGVYEHQQLNEQVFYELMSGVRDELGREFRVREFCVRDELGREFRVCEFRVRDELVHELGREQLV